MAGQLDPEAQVTQPLLGAKADESGRGEHWTRRTARAVYSHLSHFGASLLFGLITGVCLRTIGQSIAIALVLLFIGFQVLAYYGFVNLNWSRFGRSIGQTLDISSSEGKVEMKRVTSACGNILVWALSWGVLSVVGFLLGFYVGWVLVRL